MNRSAKAKLRRLIDQRVGKIARELRDICKESVSVPYPPSSSPGEPPAKRTGGLQRAIFAERIRQMEWCYGIRRVKPDPSRPNANRENIGLWMEFGTSGFRQAFPTGAQSLLPRGTREDSATTGHGGSAVEPRPFLLPVLTNHGAKVVAKHMRGAVP